MDIVCGPAWLEMGRRNRGARTNLVHCGMTERSPLYVHLLSYHEDADLRG